MTKKLVKEDDTVGDIWGGGVQRVKSWRGEKNRSFRKLKMAHCSQRAKLWGKLGKERGKICQSAVDSVRS